jgi:hypothetical protein
MTIDEKIGEFEDRLTTQLQYALFVNIDINYWEELDELDHGSIQVIKDIVDDIFAPMLLVYRRTIVGVHLLRCLDLIKYSLVASMNVPFPRDPILHVHRVVQNMMDIFIRTTYAPLRTEMIMIDHNARVIQRVWREANTNPSRFACRRRLMREFENIVLCTPMVYREA